MLSIALEAHARCEKCGTMLPLNALVEDPPCPSCHRPVPIKGAQWGGAVSWALSKAPELAPREDGGYGERELFQVTFRLEPPRCPACGGGVPLADPDPFARRGWAVCVACGARLGVRYAPRISPRVPADAILVGEDLDQVPIAGGGGQAPDGPRPVSITCPNCGAALPVDGSARRVRCTYCQADAYLPDALWQRLHPVRTVAPWYLLAEPPSDHRDLAVDREGNLYLVGPVDDALLGQGDEEVSILELALGAVGDVPLHLWSVGPTGKKRWVREDLSLDEGTRLAMTPAGVVLVGTPAKQAVLAVSTADGRTVGKLGGPGLLDAQGMDAFTCDADGSILVFAQDRLRRFGPDGREVAPWPGAAPAAPAGAAPWLDDAAVADRPVAFRTQGIEPTVGWDGCLYLRRGRSVVKLDRQGRVVYRVRLDVAGVSGRVRAAASGWLFALGSVEETATTVPQARAVVIVSPDGREQRRLYADARHSGPLGDEDTMAVGADGTLWLLAQPGRLRVIGPDGRVRLARTAPRAAASAQPSADW